MSPTWLPADWRVLSDGRVLRPLTGEVLTFEQALILRDLLVTRSRVWRGGDPRLRKQRRPVHQMGA